MGDPKNIQIPIELFKDILYVFEYIDISNYADDFKNVYNSVFEALESKKNALDARKAYSKLVHANKSGNEEAQTVARAEYLGIKNDTSF